MMAASVPILRTLLRQAPEPTKPPTATMTMTRRTGTTESFSAGSKNTVVIESNRSSAERRISFWGLLGEEKDSGHSREGSGQIWRVNEVAVEYEPRKPADV